LVKTVSEVGHIFRWDLDKTYLATEFDSALDLLKTFRQTPDDKRNVPGSDALLRSVLVPRGDRVRHVTFISGSPQEMREVLTKKLQIDGIEPAHFVLKPNLQNLFKGRFRALRGQVGYKLHALMTLRNRGPIAPETLFGDDAEADAFIYSLYADIAAGRVGRELVKQVLKKARVYDDTADAILAMIRAATIQDTARRIFINLDRHTPTGNFRPYGGRLVPVHNYFQAAIVLYGDGVLDAGDVLRIGISMNRNDQFTPAMLANSLQDLIRRRRLTADTAWALAQDLPSVPVSAEVPRDMTPEAFVAELGQRLSAHRSGAATLLGDTGVPDYLALVH
jgi:hypothetical protein